MFWHPRMSGYIMEPIRDHEDYQGSVRNVKKGKKTPNGWFSKETAVLTYFCQGYRRYSSCSGLLTCQGTLWSHSETMKTSKEPSERAQMVKRVFFKRDSSLDAPFSRYLEKVWVLCIFFTCEGTLRMQSETMWTLKEPSEMSKRPKAAKRLIFKGDSSLDAFILLFWSPHRLQLVPSCTLKCEEYVALYVSTINKKKVCQDCCLLWKSTFWLYLSFFNIPDSFFKVLIVSVWFHKVPWHARIQEHQQFLALPWKSASRLPSSFKTTLSALLAIV